MNKGKKITLYLNDGLPKGIREISIDQWSGKAICGPRNKIDEIIKLPELDKPCVYFLVGNSEEGEFFNIYVGEADPFNTRVRDHLRNKDWWEQVVVFCGSNNNPNKTGIQYLETRCIEKLKEAGKCVLMNGNNPTLPNIPREDIPGLENFLENISLVTPLLGYDIFTQEISAKEITNKQFIHCTGKGAKADAVLLDDGKVRVLKGSTAIKDNSPAFEIHNYRKLKDEILRNGRLTLDGDFLIFTDDYVFDSLSAAAAVILARSAQGPKEWKNKDGVSLKDLSEN